MGNTCILRDQKIDVFICDATIRDGCFDVMAKGLNIRQETGGRSLWKSSAPRHTPEVMHYLKKFRLRAVAWIATTLQ